MFGKVGESFRNAIEDVRRSGLQFYRHPFDLLHDFAPCRIPGQLQVCVFERTPKAAHSVTVLADIAALGFIEDVAYVFARIAKMFELGNEVLDGLLEKNIVFPERVVRVNQERVSRHPAVSPIPSRTKSNRDIRNRQLLLSCG